MFNIRAGALIRINTVYSCPLSGLLTKELPNLSLHCFLCTSVTVPVISGNIVAVRILEPFREPITS